MGLGLARTPLRSPLRAPVRSTLLGLADDVVAGPATLAFHAADQNLGSFDPSVIVGTGAITEARTSTLVLPNDSSSFSSYGSTVPGEYYYGAKWWLYCAPAATNPITHAWDLTNGMWAHSASGVLDQVGVTGTANEATIIEDNDGAAFEKMESANYTVANDGDTHVARLLIKKDSDTTRFPAVQALLLGGTGVTYTPWLNTQTGAVGESSAVTGATSEANDMGDWWEWVIEVTNNTSGNVNFRIDIYPAGGTVFETLAAAATGTIIVGHVEARLSSTIENVRGSALVRTNGASATVNKTDISFDDADHDQTSGGWYAEVMPLFSEAGASGDQEILSLNAGADLLYYDAAASQGESSDGTNVATRALSSVAGTTFQIAVAYGGTSMRMKVDGNWGAEGSYDGGYPSGTALEILRDIAQTCLIRDIRFYSGTFAEAQVSINALM